MSEIAWFGVVLGLLVLVLVLQAVGSHLSYHMVHGDHAGKRKREDAMRRHPSSQSTTPKAA